MDEVNTIAGAIVDPQFHHASADAPRVAQISLLHSANADNNPCDGVVILQTAQSCLELVRLTDLNHAANVAYGLQVRKMPGRPGSKAQ